MRPRARLASIFVLLALAHSGCGGDADPDEGAVKETGPVAVEQAAFEAGYQTGYNSCENLTPRQVAREFDVSSDDPLAAADAFAASFESEQRDGASEGCYDALVDSPPRFP
jgi:hypothetical protein